MPDTSPTPTARPADLLRAAAVRARETADPLHTVLALLLEAVAVDAIRCRCVPECPTGAALAVARQLLGTTVAEGSGAVLEPQDHPGADLFAALQHAGLDVDEANARMYAYAALVLRQEKAVAAPPAPADRAAVLNEVATQYEQLLADLGADTAKDPRYWTGVQHVTLGLRRLAGEAPASTPLAARVEALAAEWERRGEYGDSGITDRARELRAVLADGAAAGVQPPTTSEARPDDIQVWPLTRVLTEVRCGSQDWTWDEEWADLDQRHAETGYLDRLEQQIRANGITMPVLIGSDGRLWDGHHRLRIAVRLGIAYVPVEITPSAVAPAPEVARG